MFWACVAFLLWIIWEATSRRADFLGVALDGLLLAVGIFGLYNLQDRRPPSSVTQRVPFEKRLLMFSRERYLLLAGGRPDVARSLFSLDSIAQFLILSAGATVLFLDRHLSMLSGWSGSIIAGGLLAVVISRLYCAGIAVCSMFGVSLGEDRIFGAVVLNFLTNFLSSTLLVLLCLFHFGAVDGLAYIFITYWPRLTQAVGFALAQLIAWLSAATVSAIATGVLSNAIYGFLKGLFMRRMRRGHELGAPSLPKVQRRWEGSKRRVRRRIH
jgi:hypothetical protein